MKSITKWAATLPFLFLLAGCDSVYGPAIANGERNAVNVMVIFPETRSNMFALEPGTLVAYRIAVPKPEQIIVNNGQQRIVFDGMYMGNLYSLMGDRDRSVIVIKNNELKVITSSEASSLGFK